MKTLLTAAGVWAAAIGDVVLMLNFPMVGIAVAIVAGFAWCIVKQ